MSDYRPSVKPPAIQQDLVLNQPNPGTGVPYPLLLATANVRIISIACACTWTVQPTPLEARVTVDGIIWNFQQANPVTARQYIPQILAFSAPAALPMADSAINDPTTDKSYLLEGKIVAVEFEVTGGTVQNLDARIKWALY